MSLIDAPICDTCFGYQISGTLKRIAGMTLDSRCRCDDTEQDRRTEAELREKRSIIETETRPLSDGWWRTEAA